MRNIDKPDAKDMPKVKDRPSAQLEIMFGGSPNGICFFAIHPKGQPGQHIVQGFLDEPRKSLADLTAAVEASGK